MGGDFILEFNSGGIESTAVSMANFSGLLATNKSPTFLSSGEVAMPFAGYESFYTKVGNSILEDDGKIFLVGVNQSNIIVAKYNDDGTLDSTFSTDGIVAAPMSSSIISGTNVTTQSNGEIILTSFIGATDTYFLGKFHLASVRFHIDGTPDITYGDNGYLYTPY